MIAYDAIIAMEQITDMTLESEVKDKINILKICLSARYEKLSFIFTEGVHIMHSD